MPSARVESPFFNGIALSHPRGATTIALSTSCIPLSPCTFAEVGGEYPAAESRAHSTVLSPGGVTRFNSAALTHPARQRADRHGRRRSDQPAQLRTGKGAAVAVDEDCQRRNRLAMKQQSRECLAPPLAAFSRC